MRTNIVIDDKLMRDALRATGVKTKREAVELGLRTLLRLRKQTEIRRLRTGAPSGFGRAIELDRTWAERAAPFLADLAAVTRAEITFADLEGAKARLRIQEEADVGPLIEAKRKKLREARTELERKRAKLANEGFVSKAPAEVVEGERAKVVRLEDDERRLLAELSQLGASGD